jgi:hypothetical protein
MGVIILHFCLGVLVLFDYELEIADFASELRHTEHGVFSVNSHIVAC